MDITELSEVSNLEENRGDKVEPETQGKDSRSVCISIADYCNCTDSEYADGADIHRYHCYVYSRSFPAYHRYGIFLTGS